MPAAAHNATVAAPWCATDWSADCDSLISSRSYMYMPIRNGAGLPSYIVPETLRYLIGTTLVVCHGSIHPEAGLFIGSIDANGTLGSYCMLVRARYIARSRCVSLLIPHACMRAWFAALLHDGAGHGVNLMQSMRLLEWGQTRAWYEALWQCSRSSSSSSSSSTSSEGGAETTVEKADL